MSDKDEDMRRSALKKFYESIDPRHLKIDKKIQYPPDKRLEAFVEIYGTKTGLRRFTNFDIIIELSDDEIELIIDHFTQSKLTMPWEYSPFWKNGPLPENESLLSPLPGNYTIQGEEYKKPDTFGLSQSANKKDLSLEKSFSLLEKTVDLNNEDISALNSVADYLNLQSWGNKYTKYFLYVLLLSFPVLYGAIKAQDIDQSFMENLIDALSVLENYSNSGVEVGTSEFNEALSYFSEFDGPYPPGNVPSKVSLAVMKKIWTNRIAIALWSDVNNHWPWKLETLYKKTLNSLLGWNPTNKEQETSTSVWPWQKDPELYSEVYNSRNGHRIFQYNDGYHTGRVWDSNPFRTWKTGYFEIKPLFKKANLYGRKAAVFATTEWLRRRGFYHSHPACPSTNKGLYPGVNAGDTDPLHDGTTSIEEILNANFSGCQRSGPFVVSLLRSMNVYSTIARTALPKYSFSEYRMDDREIGHAVVICPSKDISLAVFHADDIISFKGQRYGDPESPWIPLAEWLMQIIMIHESLSAENPKEYYDVVNAHFYNITKKQVLGMKEKLIEFQHIDSNSENSEERRKWMKRILSVLSNQDFDDEGFKFLNAPYPEGLTENQNNAYDSWFDELDSTATPTASLARNFLRFDIICADINSKIVYILLPMDREKKTDPNSNQKVFLHEDTEVVNAIIDIGQVLKDNFIEWIA